MSGYRYRLAAALLFALTLGMLWTPAHASFPASTDPNVCTTAPCFKYQYSGGTYQWTYLLACESSASARSVSDPTFNFTNPRISGTSCLADRYYKSNGTFFSTSTVGVATQSVAPASPYFCPANATLAGSTCTCSAGYAQDGSTCVAQQTFDNAACKALADGLNFVGAPMVHYGTAGLTACFGGYVMSGTGSASGGGQAELYGPFKCTGANASTCAVTPKPVDITANCSSGTYPGTVNGVQVCVPATNSTQAPTTTTTAPPAGGGPAPEIPGAPAGTTSEEKQTTCDGPTCTTTTTYKDSGGTSTGTKTESTPKSTYCAENPKAPGCESLEKSTFSGACTGGFTFKGDAIQGAIAKEVYNQNCIWNKATDESAKYDDAKTKTGDVTGTLPGNTTVNIGPASFDTSDSIGGKQCIGNVTGTVLGTSITLPFGDYICPHAQNLRLILLALGFIIGYVIIARRS